MNINIINQTPYKQLTIVYNGVEYVSKSDETITLSILPNNSKIEVLVMEKNAVILNLLFAIIDGFVDGESVINCLYCDATIHIVPQPSSDTIILKGLEYRDDKNGYIYESVHVKDDGITQTISYNLKNTDKAKKRALFYYRFVVSWLPFIIVLLGYYFLFKGNILAVLASLLVFAVFTIPSWRKASKVKKYYSTQYANQALLNHVAMLNSQENNNGLNTPNDLIGKAVYKSLDFLFKRKNKEPADSDKSRKT